MVEAFVSTKFFLSVASKMNYDDGIVFTENNIVSYLAELEEYIGSLVTYMAFKRDDPNAATSAIPLAQLNEKKFTQKELEIEPPAPQSYKREDPVLEAALRDGHIPGEDEDFFTEAKLMQYFQKVVEREKEEERVIGGTMPGLSEGNTLQPHRGEGEPDEGAQEF